MSHQDSYDAGYERGHADGLDGRPQRQPLADPDKLLKDPSYAAFWQGNAAGWTVGETERRAREMAQGVGG